MLHYPGSEKSVAFSDVFKRKLDAEDFNFRGAWFPEEVIFRGLTVTKPADFAYATFNGKTTFIDSQFKEETSFINATFGERVSFTNTTFSAKVNFERAVFNEAAYFMLGKFNAEVDFFLTTFKDDVRFIGGNSNILFGDESSLSLRLARVERPDHFSFYLLKLRPHWFALVDARKFEFVNVEWNWRDIKRGISSIDEPDALSAHGLLAIAYRNLAVNTEESHNYEEASKFRYMAMEARRLEKWRGFVPWRLSWWYWLASGYGERVWRAFVVLLSVWLVAAALYTRVGFVRWEPRVVSEQEAAAAKRDEVGQPLQGWRPLTYSLQVMTLQKPEPRPATDAAQAVVMLETILGPVQAALLALAIRRKFMR
ncbi:MAG TPA: pentapeptide repeat-containing protein [Pyrinomonadaceae bacterium]|nr:pentapeptide repeat-containing protein [Pyrinomonadaceae bacterium]